MNINSNTQIYSTLSQQSLQGIVLANALVANSITEVVTASSTASVLLDLLFRSSSSSTIYIDIIICPTGQQSSSSPNIRIPVAANSGDNGSTPIASLSSLVPSLFSIDLAGNRVIGLEAGQSVYVKNIQAISVGQITITKIVRDF